MHEETLAQRSSTKNKRKYPLDCPSKGAHKYSIAKERIREKYNFDVLVASARYFHASLCQHVEVVLNAS
jgi:hypothetical protein